MKLISMTDFVLEQEKIGITYLTAIEKCINYAKFLKQPLELWMFVTFDENGNELEEPTHYGKSIETMRELLKEYKQAKERCLFEGFKFLEGNEKVFHIENKKCVVGVGFRNGYYKTVEDIICTETTLTQTAIKQLGL